MSKNQARKSRRRGRSGQDEGFWAGYVGALVNVVLTLLFLVAVLAAGSYVLGVEFSRKVVERAIESGRQQLRQVPQERRGGREQVAEKRIEVVELTLPDTARLAGIDTVRTVERQELLQVKFPAGTLQLGEAARRELAPRFREVLGRNPDASFTVWALSDAEPQNRRVSFIRIMQVREFLGELGVGGGRVATRILPGRETGQGVQLVYVLVHTNK